MAGWFWIGSYSAYCEYYCVYVIWYLYTLQKNKYKIIMLSTRTRLALDNRIAGMGAADPPNTVPDWCRLCLPSSFSLIPSMGCNIHFSNKTTFTCNNHRTMLILDAWWDLPPTESAGAAWEACMDIDAFNSFKYSYHACSRSVHWSMSTSILNYMWRYFSCAVFSPFITSLKCIHKL